MTKTIGEVVRERGACLIKPKGMSMYPMLMGGKCEAYIIKPAFPLKKYDVPVYLRSDGSYVMHRILEVAGDGYVCCGDNQWVLERGITDAQIVGVLDSWYKKGKKHTVRDGSYQRYVRFWCKSLSRRRRLLFFAHRLRALRYRARSAGGKILRKLGFKKK